MSVENLNEPGNITRTNTFPRRSPRHQLRRLSITNTLQTNVGDGRGTFEDSSLNCIVCNKNISVKIADHRCNVRDFEPNSDLLITRNTGCA
jgi:hypothetical protein